MHAIALLRAKAAVLGAVMLLVAASPSPGAGAGTTKRDLAEAKRRLAELQEEIEGQRARVSALQGGLNDIAARVTEAQAALDRTFIEIFATRALMQATEARYQELRGRLNARARAAYIQGPGSGLAFVLSAGSLADLADGIQFLAELTAQDADLASETRDVANRLAVQQAHLEDELARQREQKAALDADLAELQARFDEQAAILGQLAEKGEELDALVDELEERLEAEELAAARRAARLARLGIVVGGPGPFFACPVQGPRAYGDSFGAPRFAGGYHPHAGTDILAPLGTPIVAPFAGTAVRADNGLGGVSVKVFGRHGWVYNAHLSRVGQLGPVEVGAVIGYVGNTGDARGGPYHDHFEWHPTAIPPNPWRSPYGYTMIGSAIDPYPYLREVC